MLDGIELTTDNTDEYGNTERDDNPNHSNAAGAAQLFFFADRHKAQQNLRHTEVSEAPSHHGANGKDTVRKRFPKDGFACFHKLLTIFHHGIGKTKKFKKAGNGFCVFKNVANAASFFCAENNNNGKSDDHNDRLHEIRSAFRKEAAEDGVKQNKHSSQNQHGYVGCAEQGGKEFSASDEAAGRVNGEENQNEHRGKKHNALILFTKTVGKEFGQGDGIVCANAVTAKTLGYDEPVEVGSYRKTEGRPKGIGKTAPIGDAGKPHQKPSAHIRGFGTHGSYPRAERSAS